MAIIEKGDNPYSELFRMMWYDFSFDGAAKKSGLSPWKEQNAPYSTLFPRNCYSLTSGKNHPISTAECPSVKWKVSAWENGAENLVVTPQDAEADEIISAELENYVAGNQTMDEAIANMDKNLKAKIGKAEIVK